jgi:HD superfamily phosphohydrolase
MTKPNEIAPSNDNEMREILETLLADDEDITARAVARLHPSINAASSITRSEPRSKLLAEYQQRQAEYRRWRARVAKRSGADTATSLADKNIRIAELESTVELLTASHLAMLRAVGELGGFSTWAKFYEPYREARDKLAELGALREAAVSAMSPDSRVEPARGPALSSWSSAIAVC